jgi:hypothetical protein
MKKSLLILVALFCSCCQKRGMDSASMFNKIGDLKEKIALVHMIDSSSHTLTWDISSELSSYLQRDLGRKDTLYVVPTHEEVSLSSVKNPFSHNTSWIEQDFPHIHYVAFTELLKYEEPHEGDSHLGENLSISVRVRVFKKTDQGFIPILQEIVQQSYMIPSLLSKTLNLQPKYNTQGYDLSPLGVAHQNFSSLVAKRIRDYINP